MLSMRSLDAMRSHPSGWTHSIRFIRSTSSARRVIISSFWLDTLDSIHSIHVIRSSRHHRHRQTRPTLRLPLRSPRHSTSPRRETQPNLATNHGRIEAPSLPPKRRQLASAGRQLQERQVVGGSANGPSHPTSRPHETHILNSNSRSGGRQ